MDQSPAAAPSADAVAANESAALATLKEKLLNPLTPTLDLARTIQGYLRAFPQTHRSLAEKLGLPNKRSYISEVVGLLDLPDLELEKIEGQVVPRRAIQKLQGVDQAGNRVDQRGPSVDQGVDQVDQTVDHVDQRRPSVDQGVDQQINPVDQVKSPNNTVSSDISGQTDASYPLVRDTVNAVVGLVFFWNRNVKLGEVAERWMISFQDAGWLRTGLSVMAIGLAGFGGYQAAHIIQVRARRFWADVRAAAVAVPRPQIQPVHFTGSRWISGHRLELRWNPTGPDYRYRIYVHSLDDRKVEPLKSEDVKGQGAIISVNHFRGKVFLSVTAISPNDEESPQSELIEFEPTPVNSGDIIEPLPMQGAVLPKLPGGEVAGNGGKGGSAYVPLKAPVELHADVKTPDLIRLTWRAVGPDARYNVYSSATRTLSALRKENDHPMKSNTVDWTPETGLERYWIVATAVDAQNHESAYSEAIEVVRHPEKSDSSAVLNDAAGQVRKLLPW